MEHVQLEQEPAPGSTPVTAPVLPAAEDLSDPEADTGGPEPAGAVPTPARARAVELTYQDPDRIARGYANRTLFAALGAMVLLTSLPDGASGDQRAHAVAAIVVGLAGVLAAIARAETWRTALMSRLVTLGQLVGTALAGWWVQVHVVAATGVPAGLVTGGLMLALSGWLSRLSSAFVTTVPAAASYETPVFTRRMVAVPVQVRPGSALGSVQVPTEAPVGKWTRLVLAPGELRVAPFGGTEQQPVAEVSQVEDLQVAQARKSLVGYLHLGPERVVCTAWIAGRRTEFVCSGWSLRTLAAWLGRDQVTVGPRRSLIEQ